MPTDDEILAIAGTRVPDYLRAAGRIVRPGLVPSLAGVRRSTGVGEADLDDHEEMAIALAKKYGVTLEEDQDAVDVEYSEAAEGALRSTTVVQLRMRAGQLEVVGVLKRA